MIAWGMRISKTSGSAYNMRYTDVCMVQSSGGNDTVLEKHYFKLIFIILETF